MISFTSSETHLLLNPRMPETERARLEHIANEIDLRGHVWLTTSGSSGALKLVALSKEAILVSARAVNDHLDADGHDRWCCVLPLFHVGGLAIHARASLTGSDVVTLEEWNPHAFADACLAQNLTLSALVPAQVSDLVASRLSAPPSLRAVVIGGGALDPALGQKARTAGWPLLPSYGMTECCSQVATAERSASMAADPPPLKLLSHLEARTEEDRLAFRGPSLLTGYGIEHRGSIRFDDPKKEGWFLTDDVGHLTRSSDGTFVGVEGRRGDFLKIGGELVSLARLDRILASLHPGSEAAVVPMADDRLGWVIHLASTGDLGSAEVLRERFNEQVLPFERIRSIHLVERIPRSGIGKLLRGELASLLRGPS